MTTDDIWHLVDFVLDLPYQPGSQYHTDAHMEQRRASGYNLGRNLNPQMNTD